MFAIFYKPKTNLFFIGWVSRRNYYFVAKDEFLDAKERGEFIETAEFAVARGINNEPAFAWWVPYTLRWRDRIIAGVNSRIHKVTHKYGIEIPNSVEHAKKLDEKNGNTFWTEWEI